MEPWDGPAADGVHRRKIVRRRNRSTATGCVPARYRRNQPMATFVLGSETGTSSRSSPKTHARARADSSPGSMFLVDTEQVASSTTTKSRHDLHDSGPTGAGSATTRSNSAACSTPPRPQVQPETTPPAPPENLRLRPRGTEHDLTIPMAASTGRIPSGRWAPTPPLAVLSRAPKPAVQLLQAALRPGHQPAHRPAPRGLVMSLAATSGRAQRARERPRTLPHAELSTPS